MPTPFGKQKKIQIALNGYARTKGLMISVLAVLSPSIVYAQPECNQTGTAAQLEACVQANPIVNRLEEIINFLSIGVGVVVVAVIIFGGIQYMTADGSAQATAAAKSRITNALIALLAFIFTYAFLQWLVPGGVFN